MINTDYIEISRYSESVVKQLRWQRYLLLGLATNVVFWGSALLYLKVTPPTYTSYSAINLPGGGSDAKINLPEIGQASYENLSPYASIASQDPREVYKFIAGSEPVLKAAAAQLQLSVEELGQPRIKVKDNSTLMEVEFKGTSPEEAQKKSLAFYKAFEARLNELRTQEATRRDIGFQAALDSSQKKLQVVQKRLSDYKASSGLSSDEQISTLTVNIEQLRKQRAEIVAQQQQASTRLNELSTNLKLSAHKATDAFALQADQIFQQNLKDYSEASATLDILNAKFLPSYPTVAAQKTKRDAAQKALLARSQSLLGRPVSLATIEQLNLNSTSSGTTPRESLSQELVTVQAEQKGLTAQAKALEQQIAQLEVRLKSLTQQQSTLDALKRDTQVAEAVFSSTMTRLDIGKSNAFGSYPLTQIVIEPTLPNAPTSPKKKLVLMGTSFGSLFVSLGLAALGWRERKKMTLNKTVDS